MIEKPDEALERALQELREYHPHSPEAANIKNSIRELFSEALHRALHLAINRAWASTWESDAGPSGEQQFSRSADEIVEEVLTELFKGKEGA